MYIYPYNIYTYLKKHFLKQSNFCLNYFFIRLQIKLLNAKINNKINITISDKIDITSYRDQLSTPYNIQKLTKRLYILQNVFINIYKQIINHIL